MNYKIKTTINIFDKSYCTFKYNQFYVQQMRDRNPLSILDIYKCIYENVIR